MPGYPLAFRPNMLCDLYDVANNLLASNLNIQVLKPLIANSANTYTSGGKTIFSPGSTIVRGVVQVSGLGYDIPGGSGQYFKFPADASGRKWRIASGFEWCATGVTPYVYVLLGQFT